MAKKGLIIGIAVIIVILLIVGVYMLMSAGSDEIVVAAATPAAASAPASNYPSGLKDGDSVGAHNLGIWRLANGGRMWYSPAAYASYGSPAYTQITPDQMTAIPAMGNVAVRT